MPRRIVVPAGHKPAVMDAVRAGAALRHARIVQVRDAPPRWTLLKHQEPPKAEWDTWGLLGGRGSGKTFAGAAWCLDKLRRFGKDANIGVGGATNGDVRAIAAEDPKSGLITLGGLMSEDPINGEFVSYKKSTPMEAVHRGGGHVTFIGADEPDRLRGYNFTHFWADEVASWPAASWDNAVFCTRSGEALMMFTTTPKPRAFLKDLLADGGTVVVVATTYDNPHLAERSLARFKRRYEGTRVGRQELYAILLADVEGAWWHSECDIEGLEGACSKESGHLEGLRVDTVPLRPSVNGDAPEFALNRVVVAIDPAGTRNDKSDYTGIVTAGLGDDGDWYVMTSEGVKLAPHSWAQRAIDLYDEADGDRIVAERNHGGEMVEETIRNVRDNISLKTIHASRGKATRAEPIAALFQQGRVHMVGVHADLEGQMCGFPSPDLENDDILDAMVYALTELDGGGGWILG